MERFIQVLVDGIATGSIYGAIALALVLIFRSTGVVNFAQGVFAVLAGLLTYSLGKHLSLPLSAVLATLVTAFVATLVAVVAVGIRGRTTHLASLIITVGIAIFAEENNSGCFEMKRMSSYFVMTQNGPSPYQCTGSSRRSDANAACGSSR